MPSRAAEVRLSEVPRRSEDRAAAAAADPAQRRPPSLPSIATAKYADGLPLYRQETMLVRGGIDLSRATLAHWMVALGSLVQPLVNLIREQILDSGYVQADDTTSAVLKESVRPRSSRRRALAPGARLCSQAPKAPPGCPPPLETPAS